jgi:hypothetical protein
MLGSSPLICFIHLFASTFSCHQQHKSAHPLTQPFIHGAFGKPSFTGFRIIQIGKPLLPAFIKGGLKEGICSMRSHPRNRDIALITIGRTSGEMGKLKSALHRETSGILRLLS